MNSEPTQYLVLRVADSFCALPVTQVAEVLRPQSLTADSRSVPGLLGLARLRGEPVPVFSLAQLLGLGSAAAPAGELASPRLVSVRLAGRAVALLVDEVVGLQVLSANQLTTIHLPGGREQQVGQFDDAFARLIELSGLLPQLPPGEPV
jgi:purine-binding chemotaxis protein CheW